MSAPVAAAGLALGVLLSGCDHTAPCTTTDQGPLGPFSDAVPVRLTYAPGAGLMPAFAEDGSAVVYVYARGTADRDRCLAVVPVTGGTRTAEACALPLEGEGITDAFSFPALGPGGRIVASRHGNLPIGAAPSTGSVQLLRADSTGSRVLLLPLMVQPPEGTRPWMWMVTPAWTGPDRFVGIAAEHAIGSWDPFRTPPPSPFDTLYVGSAIVEIDRATTPVTLPGRFGRIAAAPDGRLLVAEVHTAPGQADLYLLRTDP